MRPGCADRLPGGKRRRRSCVCAGSARGAAGSHREVLRRLQELDAHRLQLCVHLPQLLSVVRLLGAPPAFALLPDARQLCLQLRNTRATTHSWRAHSCRAETPEPCPRRAARTGATPSAHLPNPIVRGLKLVHERVALCLGRPQPLSH